MANLGVYRATGNQSADNRIVSGGWVVEFGPENMPRDNVFEVWHGAATGPGGYFYVILNGELFGVGENGIINEYAPNIPMYVVKGSKIEFHWSIGSGAAPTVVLYFRTPEAGII